MTDVPASELPPDLEAMAARFGSIVAFRRLTVLDVDADQRACYRIDFADGRQVKLRRFAHRDEAARALAARARTSVPILAPILGGEDRIVVEGWIPGRSLDAVALDPDLAARCGTALATLHAAASETPAQTAVLRDDRRRTVADGLALLGARGVIDSDTAARGAELAASVPLATAQAGIVHGDFCGENLVVTSDGAIVAVDNETMRPELLDYDLGRVWYRWPMGVASRRAFIEGYARARSPDGFLAAAAGWILHGAIDAARYRLMDTRDGPAAPLAVIIRILGATDHDPIRLLASEADHG